MGRPGRGDRSCELARLCDGQRRFADPQPTRPAEPGRRRKLSARVARSLDRVHARSRREPADMMLAEPAARGSARQHWWKALLALSLALNLFFVIGATWIRIRAPAPMPSPQDRLERMAGDLSLDPQQKQGFIKYSQAMRDHLQAMHEAVQPLIGNAWSEVGKPQADE